MKYLLSLLLLLSINSFGQTITHRMLLFGDAGEINEGQQLSIKTALGLVIPEKTSVYFLGDNIYPVGMGLDSASALETEQILRHQYAPFIYINVPVTFIAGNHDWDKSGKQGLEKVKAQEAYLFSRSLDLLKFVPKAGTADVSVVDITNTTKAILYDSEYLLFPHHSNPDSALSEEVRNIFLNNIKSLISSNPDQTILILSHHPMLSYGEHGKNITWKDHVFPLTRKWKNLYVPLPIIGSLYPLLRNTIFHSAEDMGHPVYQQLIEDITAQTSAHKNIIFIAGHDHGLQFIENQNITQIVTGSGSKTSHIAHNSAQRFVSNKQGFCVLDVLSSEDIRLAFYTVEKGTVTKSFETLLPKK
jgi:tartrate-resistant acid phosphatase type 5